MSETRDPDATPPVSRAAPDLARLAEILSSVAGARRAWREAAIDADAALGAA